ncbi:hypothetical protein FJO69_01920 [[Mycoplasma] falconis]|uniref:Uncharacterized protein n=1 Tax=[Mycoplasma] falconis TaxID=92403 RepID=A0A501XAI1_9BACT|nr:hypothetical protein [[Mycoplasma] falconis]TPE57363.1 hypothetical protein FJO69_01920 [[Mycoplasma] falconis]
MNYNLEIDIINQQSLQSKRHFIWKFCQKIKCINEVNKLKGQSKNNKTLESFANLLDADEKNIFTNNFVNKDIDNFWYLNYFSKNTYYRKLKQVVDLFFTYIKEMYKNEK